MIQIYWILDYWIRGKKPLKVFVENRASKIKEITEGIRWQHVRTYANPADLVSHRVSPKELID